MEPMGPVCVCVHVRMFCPHTYAHSPQYNRDGNWLTITTWWTVTDRWIVMLMSCGSNWLLHLRIFKSQLSFLLWHMRIGAQPICVQTNSILWKSHWPPGYLVQINNISSYHSCSLSDPPKWQPYVRQSKEITCLNLQQTLNVRDIERVSCSTIFSFQRGYSCQTGSQSTRNLR